MNKYYVYYLLIFLCIVTSGCQTINDSPLDSTYTPEILTSEPNISTTISDTVIWYLELQTDGVIETKAVPAELSGYAVKVPLQYIKTVNNIVFTVDFFQEYYPLGGFIQLSITAVNNTGSDIEYHGNNHYGTGYFYCYNRPEASYRMIGITASQEAYFVKASVARETLKAGETTTYERLTRADPDFFKPGGSYSFFFGIGSSIIEIPVEVVRLN